MHLFLDVLLCFAKPTSPNMSAHTPRQTICHIYQIVRPASYPSTCVYRATQKKATTTKKNTKDILWLLGCCERCTRPWRCRSRFTIKPYRSSFTSRGHRKRVTRIPASATAHEFHFRIYTLWQCLVCASAMSTHSLASHVVFRLWQYSCCNASETEPTNQPTSHHPLTTHPTNAQPLSGIVLMVLLCDKSIASYSSTHKYCTHTPPTIHPHSCAFCWLGKKPIRHSHKIISTAGGWWVGIFYVFLCVHFPLCVSVCVEISMCVCVLVCFEMRKKTKIASNFIGE